MAEPLDPLVLDLVEWIARQPRLYSEVIETWRTSCPRLTIWEDAVDRGYVARESAAGGTRVAITKDGEKFLRGNGRFFPSPLAGEGGLGGLRRRLYRTPMLCIGYAKSAPDEGSYPRRQTPHPSSLREDTFSHKGRREGTFGASLLRACRTNAIDSPGAFR